MEKRRTMTRLPDTNAGSDFERVKAAMQMVWKHKKFGYSLYDSDFDLLAETAVKTMWLIEEENERKNKA